MRHEALFFSLPLREPDADLNDNRRIHQTPIHRIATSSRLSSKTAVTSACASARESRGREVFVARCLNTSREARWEPLNSVVSEGSSLLPAPKGLHRVSARFADARCSQKVRAGVLLSLSYPRPPPLVFPSAFSPHTRYTCISTRADIYTARSARISPFFLVFRLAEPARVADVSSSLPHAPVFYHLAGNSLSEVESRLSAALRTLNAVVAIESDSRGSPFELSGPFGA